MKFKNFLFFFFVFLSSTNAEEWKISLKDDKENIELQSKTNWSEIQIPINFDEFITTKSRVVWLRKEFTIDKNSQYAFLITRINVPVEIYFNEVLIYDSNKQHQEENIFISLPMNLYRTDNNVIAMRIFLVHPIASGIYGTTEINEFSKLYPKYLFFYTEYFIFAILMIGVGLFLLGFFVHSRNEIFSIYLSLYNIIIGFSILGSSELLLREVPFPKLIQSFAFSLLIFVPFLYRRFFLRYLYQEIEAKHYDIVISVFLFFFLFTINLMGAEKLKILNYLWAPLLGIIFLSFIYKKYLKIIWDFHIKDFVFFAYWLIFILYLVIKIYTYEFFETNYSLFDEVGMVLFFFPSLLIAINFLKTHREIKEKNQKLLLLDVFQTNIFQYILTLLKKPILDFLTNLQSMSIKESSPNQIQAMIHKLKDMENRLNDILELSRLETIKEPESYEEVELKEFLVEILGKKEIFYTIKIDKDIKIETSLELVNSLLVRFFEFPGFQGIKNKNLVVINDEQKVYFRFFFHSENYKIISRVYNVFKEKLIDNEGWWILGKIIKENLRILGGDFNLRSIQKHYLLIEFSFRFKNQEIGKAYSSQKKRKREVPLVYSLAETKQKMLKDHQSEDMLLQRIKNLFKKRIA
ncbi:MAG: hypothetical protein NZ853_03880 [Leptospiraceae bacterium]|nr:hypothetical protein [Leptospiraceae bacterium]MDW7975314.1 hypothetical protein [Leptospiraceae bacterium]